MTIEDEKAKEIILVVEDKAITKLILWLVIILHFSWGVTLLFGDFNTTALAPIIKIIPYPGVVLIVLSLVSAFCLLKDRFWRFTVISLIPQHFFILLSAIGSIQSIINSAFADGVIRPRLFIFADQLYVIVVAVMYTISIIYFYSNRTFKKHGNN